MATISLCMITRNEEEFIEKCINSVRNIADEIIIVDTGSTDKTKEVCKKIAAESGNFFDLKFFDVKWNDDFSAARNESISHAAKEWVLVVDADELIEKKDLAKIKELAENPEGFDGFSFEQRTYISNFFEGAVKNGTDFEPAKNYPFFIPNHLVRLFRNGIGISFRHRIHELAEDSMEEKGIKYKKTGIVLHHFGSLRGDKSISDKAEQYSRIILMQLEEFPKSARYNYQAARMYLGKNDFTGALKYFKKASKINPNHKLVFSEIAKIYMQMNDKAHAIEYFKKSAKFNPDNPSPANNLAVIYMSMGKFAQAKKLLEEQLKKSPGNRALEYNYSECLKNIK